MKDRLTEQRMEQPQKAGKAAGFYLSAIFIVSAVISMAVYAVMSSDGENTPVSVYGYTLAAAAVQAAVMLHSRRKSRWMDCYAGSGIAAFFIAVAMVCFFTGRLEWLGGLAAHNANFAPLHPSFFAAVILYTVTMVIGIAASFCRQVRG